MFASASTVHDEYLFVHVYMHACVCVCVCVSLLILQIPVLSTAEDAGHRDICYTGNTSFSGDFVVEDYKTSSGYWHRRLIFLSDRNIVQSEARLFRDYPPSHCINRPLPPVPKQPPPGERSHNKIAVKRSIYACCCLASTASAMSQLVLHVLEGAKQICMSIHEVLTQMPGWVFD